MSARPIVVASNRGPISYERRNDGTLEERRGVGGLVTAVGGALGGREATWICAAVTDEDRARATTRADVDWGGQPLHVRFADIDADTYAASYDGFANQVLWYAAHDLWDRPPDLESDHSDSWDAANEVAGIFARLIAEEAPDDAVALPQDYHLAMVPGFLRALRPDLPSGLFWHTPFAEPSMLGNLPDAWARGILQGMLAADQVGFHARRWAANFRACCRQVLGARIEGDDIVLDERRTRIGVFPLGVDPSALHTEAASAGVEERVQALDALLDGRTLVLRADRTDLTKNILRGLLAFRRVLERNPARAHDTMHAVYLSPSRPGIPAYEAYLDEVRALAAAINDRYGTGERVPVVLDIRNDFARTLAGFRRYDVLVVNPVYDGMNLVAREGPIVNERDGVLILSENAGAAEQLGDAALMVDPFDIDDTASAIERALEMDEAERRHHAAAVRAVAPGTPPARWLTDQIDALEF